MLYKTKSGQYYRGLSGNYVALLPNGSVVVTIGKFKHKMTFLSVESFENYLESSAIFKKVV